MLGRNAANAIFRERFACRHGLLYDGARGTSVTWQVIYKIDVTVGGQIFHTGATYNLDATLRRIDGSWLVDGI